MATTTLPLTTVPARTLGIAGAVALAGIGGALSVATAPSDGVAGYLWPTGLATGVLLCGTRRQTPVLTVVVALVAALSLLPSGEPPGTVVLFAVVIAAEAWVVDRLVPRGPGGRAWLLRSRDVAGYVRACVTGVAVGTVALTVTARALGHDRPGQVALAVFTGHLATQLIAVPLFLGVPRPMIRPPVRERVLRWSLTLTVAVIGLVPPNLPAATFLLLALLGWSAVRAPVRENQLLVATVGLIAATAAALRLGPFQAIFVRMDRPVELAALPLDTFLIACAVVCIPFAVAIRSQREALRDAAAERSRSDRLIHSAQGLVIIGTDDLGRINLFNEGAERILGYRAEDVVGRTMEMFHRPAEIARLADHFGCRPTYRDVVSRFTGRELLTPMDWEFVRSDGERRILAFLLTPIHAGGGELVGFLASADDMTARVRTHEELEASLARALAAEGDAVARLAEVDRAKDSFVSAVSHELRTPITNLVGYLELLQDGSYGPLTDAQDQALGRIDLNSRRLLTLIDDLLTLARLEDARPVALAPVDLAEVVHKAGTELQHLGAVNGLQVRLDLAEGPMPVRGDAGQLGRLVANLVDNAVKFTPAGGTVSMRLRGESGDARVDIEDTGMGIPHEEQGQVFGRFFRTSTAEEGAIPGTGLGLYIARAIADAHGAELLLDSVPGRGTRFTLLLPLAAP